MCRASVPRLMLWTAVILSGCRAAHDDVGSKLPVVPADSRALPGSVNSADAPEAPRVQTNRDALTSFRDPQHGLSFRYPSEWRPLATGGPMAPPGFAEKLGPELGSQAMLAEGTALANTNLIGISFSWTVKAKLNAAGCSRLAAAALPMGTEQPPESIHDVTFQRESGGDSGMCHHMQSTLDSTLHAGRCYVFERDLETTCPDIKSPAGDVALSNSQRLQLERTLDGIMSTVTLQ